MSMSDDSNGYEAIAAELIAVRGRPGGPRPAIGVRTVGDNHYYVASRS